MGPRRLHERAIAGGVVDDEHVIGKSGDVTDGARDLQFLVERRDHDRDTEASEHAPEATRRRRASPPF